METLTHAIPAEEHHSHESSLHKESEDTLDGERSSEDIADEPGIIRPIRAELKFEDEAGGDTDGEIDAEDRHPELGDTLPRLLLSADIDTLHNGYDKSQTDGERYE